MLKNLSEEKQTPCAELWLESRNVCDDPFEIIAVIDELPQLHSAVWDIFKEVSNKRHKRTVFSGSLVRWTFSTRKHGSKQLRKPTVTQQKRTS